MKLVELPSRVVGAAPVIRGMADAIGFVDLLNTLLAWDVQQCRTSPGERILAMVLDILTGKSPLYRVQDSLAETDVPLLLGRGRTAADFTDDALGRALDKLSRAGPAAVFTAVAAQAYAREAIELRTGHWDSTSRSLQGAYRSAEEEEEEEGKSEPQNATPPNPAEDSADAKVVAAPPRAVPRRGHSKDHRPDLKQILLTVFVNGEGVLRFGSVASGNTSDKTLNHRMIDDLVAAFSPQELQDLVYVADSSLVTGPNLAALRQVGLRFISRCPSTFAMAQAAKETAWAQDSWTFLGRIAARRDAADYWASEQQGAIDGVPYRLVVYRSSFLEARKEKTLDRRIAGARKTLAQAAKVFEHTIYDCREDATQAVQQWQARRETQWFAVETAINEEEQRLSRGQRGRPRKTEEPLTKKGWRVTATIGAVDTAQRQREWERQATFVLIAPMNTKEWDARGLLQEYKGQVHCERHFHFLKDPLFIDALFVKKPERVEALGYVLLMACLLYSLMERRARRSTVTIPSPSRRVLTHPTGHEIVRHLHSVQVIPLPSGARQVAVPQRFHATFLAILEALSLPDTVYTEPPRPPQRE